jgi:two-component system chemotaxis response regulator CheY/two-component system response regulator (stage 0 sporulation protein A)
MDIQRRLCQSFKLTNELTSVVVVDDDRDTVEVFCEFLKMKGLEVLGRGYTGDDAVTLYDKLKPDILFCDVMMPKHDGFYALKKIRSIYPNAKVIMVTADMTSDTEEKLKKLNASALVYKPYEIENIIETVDKVKSGSQVSFVYN